MPEPTQCRKEHSDLSRKVRRRSPGTPVRFAEFLFAMNQIHQTPSVGFNPSLPRQIANYLWRATWLKCPVCGTRPIFVPLRRTRRLADWFSPLDWCPHCRYLYEREPGYFLISQWAIGYGAGAFVGVLVYFYLQAFHSDWSLPSTLLAAALPVPIHQHHLRPPRQGVLPGGGSFDRSAHPLRRGRRSVRCRERHRDPGGVPHRSERRRRG